MNEELKKIEKRIESIEKRNKKGGIGTSGIPDPKSLESGA